MRLGLLRSIALYKSLVFSVLLHVGQFYPPDRDTLQAEHRALQLLTAAPWHTWPDALLYQLRSIGINSEARSLVVSCGSASYRLACSSRVLQEGSLDLDTLASSSDCVLFLALPEWRIAASFGHLLASLARATRLAPSLAFFDRKKFEELFRQRPNVIAILLRRAIVATGAPSWLLIGTWFSADFATLPRLVRAIWWLRCSRDFSTAGLHPHVLIILVLVASLAAVRRLVTPVPLHVLPFGISCL